jgi:hypothetical protein
VGLIDPLTKNNLKPLLVSLNSDSNKHWILAKNQSISIKIIMKTTSLDNSLLMSHIIERKTKQNILIS